MISEDDKVRARHHLGYLNVAEAHTFVLGIPAGVQTQFVTEGAFNRILPQAESRFRQLLDRLDAIEQQLEDDTDLLAVTKVDEIGIREDEQNALLTRYRYWQAAIGNMLGVPPNPFDQRFGGWGGGGGINVPVSQ